MPGYQDLSEILFTQSTTPIQAVSPNETAMDRIVALLRLPDFTQSWTGPVQ